MAVKLTPIAQQIEAIELVLEAAREQRISVDVDALKTTAADLRGRLASRQFSCADEIEARIRSVQKHPVRSGIPGAMPFERIDAMIGLAETVMGRWPTIRQALERFCIPEDRCGEAS